MFQELKFQLSTAILTILTLAGGLRQTAPPPKPVCGRATGC
jgi:hypothetical protein